MYNYIPSMTVLLVSLIVVVIIFVLRMPLIVVSLIALLLLVITVNQHFALFSSDYELLKSTQSLAGLAPYILVGVVILFALGFIFFLSRSGTKDSAVLMQNFAPPVSSAPPLNLFPPKRGPNISSGALASALNRAI